MRAGRPLNDGLRARAVIWPPLRLARMRCERGSVVAVLPASSRESRQRGGRPMRVVGLDIHRVFAEAVMLDDGTDPAARPGRHDARAPGGVRADADPRRPRRGRGDRQRERGGRGDPAACRPGGDRQPAPGAADRRGAHQDRRDRRDRAGPALRQRLPARGLDPGRGDAGLAAAGHAAHPDRAAAGAAEDDRAVDPARPPRAAVPPRRPVRAARDGPGCWPRRCRPTRATRSPGTCASTTGSART